MSDLTRLKKANVNGEVVSYVAEKTKKERTEVIRVPLNSCASDILARYAGLPGDELLPFISPQRYNDAIKEMCRLAGIDRKVMIINRATGENEMRSICELASRHMARRTFIGNLYKKVKDASVAGSLSGHKKGSRSFARYREIDDDIKQELVSLLD